MSGFPILMYHRVSSQQCPVPDSDPEETRYAVGVEEFHWQLDRMVGLELTGVSMRALRERLQGGGRVPERWVVLTFDDGNHSDYVHAVPALRARGFSATFFVGGNRVSAPGGLTPEMLSEMARIGFEIGSHGMTHRFLTTLSAEDERWELEESKRLLSDLTGTGVESFAPPGGRIGRRGLKTLSQLGYRSVCTSEFGFNDRVVQRFEYKRIPLMKGTGRREFERVVTGDSARLLPRFARARALKVARTLLGESGYRWIRSLGVRS